MAALSERGTLIIPVERAALPFLKDEFRVEDVVLVPKAEHHFTVFGFSIGKHVHKNRALLGAWLDAEAARVDWKFELGQECFHLRQPASGQKAVLDTVVVRIQAPIAEFFARARAEAVSKGATAELVDALSAPPPPHITLYTSDKDGKLGIGLNRVADLEAAIARAAAGDGSGLCAWRLPAGAVTGQGQ